MSTSSLPEFTVVRKGTHVTFVSRFSHVDGAAMAIALDAGSRSNDFAQSLLQAHDEGRLSYRQTAWLHLLATEIMDRADSRRAAGAVANLLPLVELFDRAAAAGKKFPKVSIPAPGLESGVVKLARAGDGSKTPGAINITDGRPFGVGTWFGRVNRDGTLQAGSAFAQVAELIRALAADPASAGRTHGLATGTCIYCGRALSTAESRSVGYGPICAEQWGLPWGSTAAADAADAAAKADLQQLGETPADSVYPRDADGRLLGRAGD